MSGSITEIKGDIALLKAKLERLRGGRAWDLGFSFPIRKVDDEKWEVEGIAASEVLDQQGEIIEYPALKKAFGSFLGTVREMHQAVAVGKAVSITCDDVNKCVLVRSMISKGAPLTWEKVKDKTLSGFSIGGQRLRSQLLENGIRKTTELRLTELSLVDAPANPQAFFSLVKLSEGVPRATELLATDGEETMSCAAVSLERVSRIVAAGARPLPEEVNAALKEVAKVAGTPAVGCDSTALRDFAVQGPEWGRQLQILAKGLEVSREDTDRKRIAAAAEFLLLQFASNARRASGQSVSASKLYEETAAVLAKTAAPSSLASAAEKESYDKLSSSVFTLASMKKAERVEAGGPLTLPELREMEEKLAKQLANWNEQRLPQNGPFGPAYEALTRSLMRVSSMRKRVEAKAIQFGR